MPTLTPQEFANKWSKSKLKESAASQSHFNDLCHMLGQKTPTEADPEGTSYTFEKGVEKDGGGKGFADVWYRNHFAIEYKGKHKDLGAAYQQLLQYRESLENPPLLVVTDIERFEIHTNFTGTVASVYSFTNEELPEPKNLRLLRAMFENPYSLKPTRTVESVTEEAASKFAELADGLRARGVEPQEAAHFLNKLLFCLFVEDIGLLENMFTKVVDRGVKKPESFNQNISGLFEAMASGGEFGLQDIRCFNGGLFSDGEVVSLEAEELKVLREAARLDWGSVEPAIFGTLFERSLDPSQRARLGAHYTSREDILTLIEPVLMAPLRREWEQAKATANAEAERAREQSGQKAVNSLRRAERELITFAEHLRKQQVLDPACGSGNFLYVSLKQLLDLEKEVLTFAGEIGLTPFFPEVNPEQLHGIETSPYAYELAQVAIWIGYLQWMIDNGYGTPEEPILGPMTNIQEMDALMIRDEDGELKEPDWPMVDVVVGNPPFLGGNRVRAELGDEYVVDLFKLYKGRIPAFADLVCYWFERARSYIEEGKIKRAGLLATNSIRSGASRRALERIKQTGDIFFAESDRRWVLDGAAVRVSMVGFDDGSEQTRLLDGVPVVAVNANLTSELDLTRAKKLRENAGICFYGSQQKGAFDITPDQAKHLLAQPNPFGRDTAEVVKPAVNAEQLLRRTGETWVIDFGLNMSEEEAALYEAPFEYLKQVVLPERKDRKEKRQRDYWWLHARPSPRYRKILDTQSRYIVSPSVSKYRLFTWLSSSILADHRLVVFAREDDYFFGVLHARPHELWAVRTGSFIGKGNDPSYTPSTTFETYPLPWPPGEEPTEDPLVKAIAEAARSLDEMRCNWLNPEGATETELKKRTLTNLYNTRPTWLANAHEKLDKAVFAAYGWPSSLTDEAILKNLLALNLKSTTNNSEQSRKSRNRCLPPPAR